MIGLSRHVRDRGKTRSDNTKEYIIFDYIDESPNWDPTIQDSLYGNTARVVIEDPANDYNNALNGLRFTGTTGGSTPRLPFVIANTTTNLTTNNNYMSGGSHTVRMWSRDWSKTMSVYLFSPYIGTALRINSDLDLSSCTNFGATLTEDTMRLQVYTGCTNIIFPTNNYNPKMAITAINGGGPMNNLVISGMPNCLGITLGGFTDDLGLTIGTNTAPYFDLVINNSSGYDGDLDLSGVQNLRDIRLANSINVQTNGYIANLILPNTPTSVNPTGFQLYEATRYSNGNIIVDPNQPNHLFLNNIYTAITTNNFNFTTSHNPQLSGITFPYTTNTWGYFWVNNCNLTGNLDLSPLSNFGSPTGSYFAAGSNPNLTGITYPVTSQKFAEHYVNNCNLTGTLDFRNLQNFGGDIRFHTNPNLTNVLHTGTTSDITKYYGYSCDLTGNLDLSILDNYLGGDIRLYSNSGLTAITISTSASTSYIELSNCNITGTFDLASSFSNPSANFVFIINNNVNLTNIINPPSSNTVLYYYAYNCDLGYVDFTPFSSMTNINSCQVYLQNNNMTVGEVNHILTDLDVISVGGYTGRIINISGTNAAPDGSSGGFDGLTAKSNLITKGFTVTTN